MSRIFDTLFAAAVLVVTLPLWVIAAVGIKLASPGPFFYRAVRIGLDGVPFSMFKFRTMHVTQGGAVITSAQDRRIFRFGMVLRKTKIDELPQLLNILRGDMAIVGPRPEAPEIVADAYTDWMRETLSVRPGLTSPGSLYYYAVAENQIADDDPEQHYIREVLPLKLAIDRGYLDRRSFGSDLRIILRTLTTIARLGLGKDVPVVGIDLVAARPWCADTGQ